MLRYITHSQQETFGRVDTLSFTADGAHSGERLESSPMISSFKNVLLFGFKDFHCDYRNL